MMSLQSETSTGWTLAVVRLKHIIPSSASGGMPTVGRTRLLVDGEMRRGSDREDDEGRADGITEDEKREIDVNVIRRACIVV